MPKNYTKVRFNPQNGTGYLTDLGLETSFNTGFYLPSGIPETEKSTILNNIGATALGSIGDDTPCLQSNQATPRKLRFIRFDGGSTEIPVASRADLLSAANVIRGIFKSNGLEIACIELIGEEFPNLNDQLKLNYANTFAKSHINIAAGKQSYYHGSVAYQTDANSATLSTVTGEKLRNLKLGSLKDGQITLNETDTETVVVIPEEFLDSGLEMALFFLASESIYLEVFVEKKTITDQALNEKLDLINGRLNEIAANQTNLNLTDLIDTLTPIDFSELQQFVLDLGFL